MKPNLRLDGDTVKKSLVCGLLLVFFAMLQTTFFVNFKPFGAVPDLMLSFVIAVAMSEREKWGAIVGLIAAIVIESIGGSTFTILPILYMPAGYICGYLTVYRFRDSVPVRLLFTAAAAVFRALFTVIATVATVASVSLPAVFAEAAVPEFLATVALSIFVHIITKLALRPFNLTREEKTK